MGGLGGGGVGGLGGCSGPGRGGSGGYRAVVSVKLWAAVGLHRQPLELASCASLGGWCL